MTIAVIGGSGFYDWERFEHRKAVSVSTPYSSRAVELFSGKLDSHDIVFIPRHGPSHSIPPHRINYRANIWALREKGASMILSIATVGGISREALPGAVMIPNQILDYTYGREQTFFDGQDGAVAHVDMTEPYCEPLRAQLIDSARSSGVEVIEQGTYAATQGPRFETPAEVDRLERDGAHVVGMTGMPEASLAKELELAYATIAVIVNPAAGRSEGGISMGQIRGWMASGRSKVEKLLGGAIPALDGRTYPVQPAMRP